MKNIENNKEGQEANQLVAEDGKSDPPLALTLDCELYQHYLDNSGLTVDQKREFMEALWSIVVTFVDLGFGIESVQHAIKLSEDDKPKATPPPSGSGQESTLKGDFDSAKRETTKKTPIRGVMRYEI